MREVHFPTHWINGKYSVPYTQSVLGTETVSSLAQKLLKNKKASTEEEAIYMAKELINKITNRQ